MIDPINKTHWHIYDANANSAFLPILASNRRSTCVKVMEKVKEEHPWFGIEQEYTMFEQNGHPLGTLTGHGATRWI